MQPTIRHKLCRAGFLLFCLLPTLAITGWVGVRQTPMYLSARREAWQQQLSQLLGQRVHIGEVTFPRSGSTLLHEVEVYEQETGQELLRVERLEILRGNGQLVLLATRSDFYADRFAPLWRTLHDRVLCELPSSTPPVRLAAADVTLRSEHGDQTFSDVQCAVRHQPEQTRAQIDFRVAGLEMAEPVKLRVERHRATLPPVTRWELHCGSTALPCSLLARQVPALNSIGDRGRFRGSFWAQYTTAGWEGDLSGQFLDVELDRLVTERFPHKLSGTGELVFNRAVMRNGRLVEAAGALHARQGVISRSMLIASRDALQLALPARVNGNERPLWKYEQLAVGFELTADGLILRGQAKGDTAGAVLVDRDGVLVADGGQPMLPAVALLQALVPLSEVQVPATQETDSLLHALPVPAIVAPRDTRPYVPLRLRD